MFAPMFAAHLSNRGVVSVTGPDARAFLDRLLTNHVAKVTPGEPCHAALLTPQGKILVEAIVSEVPAAEGGGFLLDCLRPYAGDLVTKLGFYKLRAKAVVTDLTAQTAVVALWGEGAPGAAKDAVPNPRLPALGFRAIVDAGEVEGFARDIGAKLVGERDYRRHRIGLGVPEAGEDYILGDTFPHEANMDQLGGIDFDKGCYVGQEVVSRMEHRASARTRVVPVIAADGGFLAEGGLPVTAGDKTIGTMGSSVEGRGLALVRLDRVADALAEGRKVMAGGVELKLVKPGWARFAFPGEAGA